MCKEHRGENAEIECHPADEQDRGIFDVLRRVSAEQSGQQREEHVPDERDERVLDPLGLLDDSAVQRDGERALPNDPAESAIHPCFSRKRARTRLRAFTPAQLDNRALAQGRRGEQGTSLTATPSRTRPTAGVPVRRVSGRVRICVAYSRQRTCLCNCHARSRGTRACRRDSPVAPFGSSQRERALSDSVFARPSKPDTGPVPVRSVYDTASTTVTFFVAS